MGLGEEVVMGDVLLFFVAGGPVRLILLRVNGVRVVSFRIYLSVFSTRLLVLVTQESVVKTR